VSRFRASRYYTLIAANERLIGMARSSASSIQVAPTFGKGAKLGADPRSFAAPGASPVRAFRGHRFFRPRCSIRQHDTGLSAGGRNASPVRKLKPAWCRGQRTVSATSILSASGPW